jgi:hypothetical protein
VQVLDRAKRRDYPSGGILDVIARQPYLLSRRYGMLYAAACLEIERVLFIGTQFRHQ